MTGRTARIVAALLIGGAVLPAAGVAGGACAPAHASGATVATHRAGLIVEFPDATVKRFCVSFAEDAISGYELLRRSGLALQVQDYGGGSLAVCSIDGKGCDFPRKPCFCECANTSDCTFWGYFTIAAAGRWKFETLGATQRMVTDGDVDGWRWGKHGTAGGTPPPREDLATVCAKAIATATAPRTPPAGGPPVAPIAVAGALVLLAAGAVVRARKARAHATEDAL